MSQNRNGLHCGEGGVFVLPFAAKLMVMTGGIRARHAEELFVYAIHREWYD